MWWEEKVHRSSYDYNYEVENKYITENIIGSGLHQSRIEVTQ